MPQAKRGNPRCSLRRSSRAGRINVSTARCLLPRDLGSTAAFARHQTLLPPALQSLSPQRTDTQHMWEEAQHCSLLWEQTPALTPRLVFVPSSAPYSPLEPVTPLCQPSLWQGASQCVPSMWLSSQTLPGKTAFAWQQSRPTSQPEPARCRTGSAVGCAIACIAVSARG